ncbi:hypothetical protein Cst_c00160 [Thermoclostridium stercorarium subsp. stercorarium DSM 8532]|jgi:8-oxo-dGTP diphosphatase|uniref:8-oxo-dGTP diphosphatase n=3 Tax=Thermoclostridium stercorarium TaxID=1510 RepID=L7VK62_THES1|nr:8-oxo-dGTP diphosphatase MutT [Thermoclostridium stercorarium]AGC67049.1 hypothetical protein Cst_c00160 [Thermoclostridium stercorarium subsp. stercorarium DSM 8532]AGI38135.1 MutT [Thermoclostridium stercorarium subsp. stercorarium DSM 8532]ANW97544.1 NUDIX hydrolase [Thermoclostridium stercorarium subsp. thermolacticum DSM 2910]ANX00104.1 NUDIX hydrolase [Thermoclostridium stercorarium subsp. leptospartum DSM 9219]UZQ85661.1 8-oxo-dGTP diphosphatase MutT [Thermoclostridium stercorarium]
MTKVAAAIIRKNGKILICKRGAGGNCGHLWEFPGGKQEDGETLTECLERELNEELGVKIRVKGVFDTVVYRYPDREIFFTFFNAEIEEGIPCPTVHEEIKWVTPKELTEYEFCPADIEIVKKLHEESG